MKALELTVYPPIPENPRPEEPLFRTSPQFQACMDWDDARDKEARLRRQKRLTDAELAAEFHAMDAERRALQHDGYDYHLELERSVTLYGLAFLPHNDETTERIEWKTGQGFVIEDRPEHDTLSEQP